MVQFLKYKEKVNKFIPRNDFDNQERECLLNLLINFNYTLIDEYITEWKFERLKQIKNRIINTINNKKYSSFSEKMKHKEIQKKIIEYTRIE